MKNHLMMEKRLDKTGKLVTRYVRADTSSTPPKGAIPPITTLSSSSVDRETKVSSILSMIAGDEQDESNAEEDSYYAQKAREFVPTFTEDTLDCVTEYIGKNDHYSETLPLWIDLYGEQEKYLRELLTYADSFDPSTDYSFVEESISYMRGYIDLLPEMEDYSKADPELQQTIRNILNTTETYIADRYEDNREDNDPILPDDLCRLVIDRPDDVERINDILLVDRYAVPERIVLMLDNPSSATSQGAL